MQETVEHQHPAVFDAYRAQIVHMDVHLVVKAAEAVATWMTMAGDVAVGYAVG
jgi:hypothetical protein